MRIDETIKEAIDRFLESNPRGAPLAEIYAAVERRIDRALRPSVRRVLHTNARPRGESYVRLHRGVYALARFAEHAQPRKDQRPPRNTS